MRYLKQSTTVTIKVGPFVDATDGVTEETALTPGVEVSKDGAAFGARSSATAVAHDAEGWYDVELDGTDTNTTGTLIVKAQDSATHLPVWHEFMVLPANVYDALVDDADKLQVDAVEISSATTAADNVEANITNLDATVSSRATQADILSDATPFAGGNVDAAVSTRSSHAAADVAQVSLSELSQGAPPAAPTVEQALMLLYMAMRNAETQTASEYTISNDAGTVIAKAALSDDGTTVTKAEMATGP